MESVVVDVNQSVTMIANSNPDSNIPIKRHSQNHEQQGKHLN